MMTHVVHCANHLIFFFWAGWFAFFDAVGGFVRKLGEMGYHRSAKKCKEKFENVHKYYKRTKEGRAGRQDGKSYRYFNQLEALHSGGGTGSGLSVSPAAMIPATTFQPPLPATPISVGNLMLAPGRIQTSQPPIAGPSAQFPSVVLPAGIGFSTSSEEEGEEDESEEGTETGGRKRKRPGEGGSDCGGSKKMMSFFEGLIKQVMERQEAMQQRFLETIEKREQDRMIREEAWKRQEMARLTREHELMAQERAMAASRDAAVIGFLQKINGQTIPTPTATAATTITTLPPPTPPSSTVTQPLLHPIQTISFQQPAHDIIAGAANASRHLPPPSTSEADAAADREKRALETAAAMSGSFDPASSSSRWPKAEVHELIKLRSRLEGKYQEAGPKGPLWEEISSEMRRIGYNRTSKRCKEKWENINKYFKKVKESSKKRPEDAKTCPYFHQLDALYKKKLIAGAGAGTSAGQTSQDHHQGIVSSTISPPLPDQSGAKDQNNNMSNNSSNKASGGHDGGSNAGSNVQIQTSNGDHPPSLQEDQAAIKKPEDIMKELMEQQQQSVMDDYDSDNLEVEEDDGEDGEEEEKNKENMAYKIQFQRQGPAGSSSNGGRGNVGASPTATSAGSFLAVVQ